MKFEVKFIYYMDSNDKINFNSFLVENNLSLRSFSKKYGFSASYVSAVFLGNKPCSENLYNTLIKCGFIKVNLSSDDWSD